MSSMFQQSFLQTSSAASKARRRSTFLAITFQVSLVAAGVILPRLYIEALPLTPPAPVVPLSMGSPSPESVSHARPNSVVPSDRAPVYTQLNNKPSVISEHLAANTNDSGTGPGPVNLTPGNGCVSNCIPGLPAVDPPHIVVASASPTPKARMISLLHPGQLIHSVQPEYPSVALQIGQQGTVNLHAVIATDGSISELRVVDGPALLQRSALDAVSQWRYQPYILNGQAVPVETQIQVRFTLHK